MLAGWCARLRCATRISAVPTPTTRSLWPCLGGGGEAKLTILLTLLRYTTRRHTRGGLMAEQRVTHLMPGIGTVPVP
jgi:hypothetical protein